MRIDGRDTVKLSTLVGAALAVRVCARRAFAEALAPGLSDPALQPKFANRMPNTHAPSCLYQAGDPARVNVQYQLEGECDGKKQ
jgi:hypothetical protein